MRNTAGNGIRIAFYGLSPVRDHEVVVLKGCILGRLMHGSDAQYCGQWYPHRFLLPVSGNLARWRVRVGFFCDKAFPIPSTYLRLDHLFRSIDASYDDKSCQVAIWLVCPEVA